MTIGNGDVWQRYTGIGVKVAVVDDGVDKTHPDLAANYDASLEVSGIDGAPLADTGDSTHGTAVAGIIGAVGQNGQGVVGVAFNSTLTSLRYTLQQRAVMSEISQLPYLTTISLTTPGVLNARADQ